MKIRANGLGIFLVALIVIGMVSERAEAQGFHSVTCTSAGGQSCNVNSKSKVLSLMNAAGIKPQLQDRVTVRDVNTNDLATWAVTVVDSDGNTADLTKLGSSTSGGGGNDDDDDTNCENGAGNEGEEECDESPILLDLDRNGFHLSGGPATFDIDSDGQLESVTWVSPNTRDGFLYLDRNGNGIVDSGLELFGNKTLLANGEFARHGYQALREFDRRRNGGNRDRVIDSSDSIFADLRVWIDDDANGICEVHETLSVAEAGVLSLNLNFRRSRRTDSHGNVFRYISRGRIEVNGESKRMKTTDVFFRILAQ